MLWQGVGLQHLTPHAAFCLGLVPGPSPVLAFLTHRWHRAASAPHGTFFPRGPPKSSARLAAARGLLALVPRVRWPCPSPPALRRIPTARGLPWLSRPAAFGRCPARHNTSGLPPAAPPGHVPAPRCAARGPGQRRVSPEEPGITSREDFNP